MQKQREYMRLARESARKRGICVVCLKNKAEPNRSRCWKCKEKQLIAERERSKKPGNVEANRKYQRELYRRKKENGICVLCSRPAFPDHTMCYEHMIRARRLGKEQYAKERKPTFKEQGLCSWCGNPVVDGYKLCAGCLEKVRERSRKGLAKVDKDKHPWRIEGETRRSKDHD